MAEIPYSDIRCTQDRSWTFPLVQAMLDPSITEGERDQAADTLVDLNDCRVGPALYEALVNPALPVAIRVAASLALEDIGIDPGQGVRDLWWASGDEFQQRMWLSQAQFGGAGRVAGVLADPGSPLYLAALEGSWAGFDTPDFVALKTTALDSPNPQARRIACDVLSWDEPVAAQSRLLERADDIDAEVAVAAINTLQYYDSQAVLIRLDELASGSTRQAVRDAAAESLSSFRGLHCDVSVEASDPSDLRYGELMRAWLDPVRELVGVLPEEADPNFQVPDVSAPKSAPLGARALMQSLDELNVPWLGKLDLLSAEHDWSLTPVTQRGELAAFLCSHADRDVRDRACSILRRWGDMDRLIDLAASDDDDLVRKSAMWQLSQWEGDQRAPRVARLAWDYVTSRVDSGARSVEALDAFVRHEERDEAQTHLLDLIESDPRDSMKIRAVELLVDARGLGPLLAEEPRITWNMHVALLDHDKGPELTAAVHSRLVRADSFRLHNALARRLVRDRPA